MSGEIGVGVGGLLRTLTNWIQHISWDPIRSCGIMTCCSNTMRDFVNRLPEINGQSNHPHLF